MNQAYLVQSIEDHPGNSGWWRLSRPVLRHMASAESAYGRICEWVPLQGAFKAARQQQRDWDNRHPRG